MAPEAAAKYINVESSVVIVAVQTLPEVTVAVAVTIDLTTGVDGVIAAD
jgi:hypothetical protein